MDKFKTKRLFAATEWIRVDRLGVLAALLIACSQTMQLVQAATVTFAFDAQITDVANGSPFDLAIAYQVGDVVHGEFTFQPSSGTSVGDTSLVSDQSFEMQLNVNGVVLPSSRFTIEVFDDSLITDFPPSDGPVDMISLGCSSLAFQACSPLYIVPSVGDPFRLRAQFDLIGDKAIMDTPEISSNLAIWNAFLLQRTLNVSFDNEGVGSVGFQALIGSFVAAPEPSSFILFLLGLLGANFLRQCRQRLTL